MVERFLTPRACAEVKTVRAATHKSSKMDRLNVDGPLCTAVNVCFWKIIQKVVPACAIISESASVRPRVRIYLYVCVREGKSIITETHRLLRRRRRLGRRQRPFNCITTHVAFGRPPIMWLTLQSQFYRDSRPAVWEFTCSSVTMCTPITFTSLCARWLNSCAPAWKNFLRVCRMALIDYYSLSRALLRCIFVRALFIAASSQEFRGTRTPNLGIDCRTKWKSDEDFSELATALEIKSFYRREIKKI